MDIELLNLTGHWKGIFNYPRRLPPGEFDAEIIDHLGTLAGETTELGAAGPAGVHVLHALINGYRRGQNVDFVKVYDSAGHHRAPVVYEGLIN